MIQFDSGGLLLQDSSELPTVPEHIPVLYADFETSSGDPSLSATNPWHDCSAIGAAVAFGYQSPIWFIPKELLVTGWWRDVLRATEVWANHSIKYDAHVSGNDVSNSPTCRLRCTLTGAKLLDSDRIFKGGYGLDVLSKEWLGTDIFRYEWAMTPYLASARNKDYGRVPIEILAEYACMDVDTNRRLDQYIENRMPEESKDVWNTEQKFTSLLLKMERRGVRVDPQQVKLKQLEVLKNLIILDAELDHLVGRAFSPSSSNDCFDVLCNQYGLPVLEWTDETKNKTGVSNPSFSAEVLEQYLVHPDAPVEVIKKMIDYRSLKTFNGLFLEAWQDIQKNGVMHPNYNQMVRTGRLSCSEPNMQQLDMFAKELIIPPPGYGIVVSDACVTEDTLVITPYGEKPMGDVVLHKLPVLGYDQEAPPDQRLKFCNISEAAYIRHDQVYRVNLENGQSIKCTADHGFIRLDGTRVDCKDLVPGDRLKHINSNYNYGYPQWRVDDTCARKHITAGLWRYGGRADGHQFHHIDEDKENWHADNIEQKYESHHKSDHAKANYEAQDHGPRIEALREALINRRSYNGEENPNWRGGKIDCYCEVCGEYLGERFPSQAKLRCRIHIRSRWDNENHKVVSVEPLGIERVYSLTNPTTHNYVTADGLVNLNSQIEFRIIVHYIGNRRCIDAYNADPWTDFHQWMADMAGMARRPAKTMNFMMGYGGGKKKTVSTMAMNKDVVGDIIERVKAAVEDPTERQAAIKRMCEQRGLEVYTGYHAALPELKPTQRMASGTAVNRGYVRNWYGRRRHLDARFAHKAFNSLCQSTAGDICKERMVALDAEIPEFEINTQVHDEVVGYAPLEVLRDPDERLLRRIVNVLCDVERPLTVPVRWTIGWSEAHWADAKSEEHERKFA